MEKRHQEQSEKMRHTVEQYKSQISLLEVSLHNESLSNEEQRAYIEVLKQALETKLNSSSLIDFLSTLKEKTQMQEVDLFIELNNVKTLIDHHQQEKSVAEDRSKGLEAEVEALLAENEELKGIIHQNKQNANQSRADIDRLVANIDTFESENQKLNQEKEALIEYADNIKRDSDIYNEKSSYLQDTVNKWILKFEDLSRVNQELERQLTTSERKSITHTSDLEEWHKRTVALETQVNDLQVQKERVAAELVDLTGRYESVLTDKKRLEMNLSDRKKDHENLQKQYSILRSDYDEQSQTAVELQSKHSEAATHLKYKEQDFKRTASHAEDLQSENRGLADRLRKLEELVREHEAEQKRQQDAEEKTKAQGNELDELQRFVQESQRRNDKERQLKADEIRELFAQNSDLRTDIRALKEEKTAAEGRLHGVEQDADELRSQVDRKQKALLNTTRELNSLRNTLEEKQEEMVSNASRVSELEAEVGELRGKRRDLQSELNEAIEHGNKHADRVERLEGANSLLTESEYKLSERIERLSSEKNELNSENQQLVDELEQTRRESVKLLRSVEKMLGNDKNSFPRPSFSLENPYSLFSALEENIKVLSLEKERMDSRYDELVANNQRQQREHEQLLDVWETSKIQGESNEKELSKCRADLEMSVKQCRRLEDQIERFKTELNRMRADTDRRNSADVSTVQERSKALEERAIKHELESRTLEYLLAKFREAVGNKEIVDTLNELRSIHFEIARLQRDRAQSRAEKVVMEDRIASPSVKQKVDSPTRLREAAEARRRLEELRDTISTTESNLDIYHSKKTALEKEVNRLIGSEKARYNSYHELEKENHYLQSETNMLNKENELLEQTRANLEASYNDVLKELNLLNKHRTTTNERVDLLFSHSREDTVPSTYRNKASVMDEYQYQETVTSARRGREERMQLSENGTQRSRNSAEAEQDGYRGYSASLNKYRKKPYL